MIPRFFGIGIKSDRSTSSSTPISFLAKGYCPQGSSGSFLSVADRVMELVSGEVTPSPWATAILPMMSHQGRAANDFESLKENAFRFPFASWPSSLFPRALGLDDPAANRSSRVLFQPRPVRRGIHSL